MQAIVQKWGNSLGFRIPSIWARENGIQNGSKVEVIMEKEKIVIVPKKKSLDEMLAMVNDENIHPEVATGYVLGKEEW